MPRISMVVRLTRDDDPRIELVTLTAAGEQWQADGTGWLSPRSGGWDRSPAGTHLNQPGGHGGNVATLNGLIFFGTPRGRTGGALYPDSAGTGKWEVSEVTDR